MSLTLRIILILAAFALFAFIMRSIKKVKDANRGCNLLGSHLPVDSDNQHFSGHRICRI